MIHTKGVLLIIRLHRLSHLPPAQSAAEILTENHVPCVVVEIGEGPSGDRIENRIPKITINPSFARALGPARAFFLCVIAITMVGWRILRTGKPRFVLAHGLMEQAIVWVISRIFRVPFAVHVHEVYEAHELSRLNRCFFSVEGPILRAASFLIFPSDQRRGIYVNRYGLKNPAYCVANCSRRRSVGLSSRWRTAWAIPETDKVLIYIGGVGDVNAILEAVVAVSQIPQIHFVIVGWCNSRFRESILQTASSLGVASRVHLTGPIKSEKWEMLESADFAYCVYKPVRLRLTCSALASNKLMESLAAGIAVLAGVTPDFKSFIERTKTGYFTDSFEPGALAKGLRYLMGLDAHCVRGNAVRWHSSEYCYEVQFEKIIRALSSHFPCLLAQPPEEAHRPTLHP